VLSTPERDVEVPSKKFIKEIQECNGSSISCFLFLFPHFAASDLALECEEYTNTTIPSNQAATSSNRM
jgi:hypothetical protein